MQFEQTGRRELLEFSRIYFRRNILLLHNRFRTFFLGKWLFFCGACQPHYRCCNPRGASCCRASSLLHTTWPSGHGSSHSSQHRSCCKEVETTTFSSLTTAAHCNMGHAANLSATWLMLQTRVQHGSCCETLIFANLQAQHELCGKPLSTTLFMLHTFVSSIGRLSHSKSNRADLCKRSSVDA